MAGKKIGYQEAIEAFEMQGHALIMTKEEFYSRPSNTTVPYTCRCGNSSKTNLSEVVRKGKQVHCNSCGRLQAKVTTKNRFGVESRFQSFDFIEHRKQVMLEKFGVENAMQSRELRDQRKNTCKERYGVENAMQSEAVRKKARQTLKNKTGFEYSHQNPTSREKFNRTLQERYGVVSLAQLSNQASKQSQILFWDLFHRLSMQDQEHCYFAEHKGEIFRCTSSPKKGKYAYKYDFVISSVKKAIEFNGLVFHPRPEQADDEVGWKLFNPKLSVQEAREQEKEKYDLLEKDGYSILTVWDAEFKKDYSILIQRCVQFLQKTKEV